MKLLLVPAEHEFITKETELSGYIKKERIYGAIKNISTIFHEVFLS